jgi:Rieske Fe-S protein
LLFDRAQSADPFVDAHQIRAEFLESMELGDLVLGLAQRRRIGKGFRHAFTGDSAGQTKLRIVTGIVGFGAMTGGFTAAPHYGCDRTGSQVAKAKELLQEFGSIRFQRIQGCQAWVFLSERYYTFRKTPQKKKNAPMPLPRRAPVRPLAKQRGDDIVVFSMTCFHTGCFGYRFWCPTP